MEGADMITGQELFAERDRIKQSLERSLQRAYENGIEAADMTMNYRIKLAQKILELKAEGTAISIIDKLAKGDTAVAKAEFDMSAAEVKYRASLENIMAQKKLFESIESDIKREYFKGE